MNLSISNIGWDAKYDAAVYNIMKKQGYCGLEIAPTRIFPEAPYERLKEAFHWATEMKEKYSFTISSMQSIWFGRQEKIFGTEDERQVLAAYTKKAIDFAEAIHCKNLVLGCPRNRNVPAGADPELAIEFFRQLGNYALDHGTVIGVEANPPIYNTNYINDTLSALRLIKEVNSDGFKLNLDVGTMIENQESVNELVGMVGFINHVHISEPGLKTIEKRTLHKDLQSVLQRENYNGFISIEMAKSDDLQIIEEVIKYVQEIFGK